MKLYFIYFKRYITNYPIRLAFLTLSVVIAVLFISFLGMLTDSIHATNQEKRFATYGEFQGMAIGISSQDSETIDSNNRIQSTAYSEVIGTVMAGYEKVYLGVMDTNAIHLSRLKLKEGSLPETADEIAIEDVTLKNINLNAGIGDMIEINVTLTQGQELKTAKKSFIIVGIFENKPLRMMLKNSYATGGNGPEHAAMPTLLISKDLISTLAQEYSLQKNVIIELKDKSEVSQIMANMNLSIPVLTNVLYNPMNSIQLKQYDDTISNDNYILIIFVFLLAIIGIIQSFYITIQERERQLGILRAIGAIQRQLHRIVLGEAFIISMVAIPLGILLSLAMLKLSILFMERFSGQAQIVVISPKTIIISAAISFASVIFAAILPAHKAMRVSPMSVISGVSAITFNRIREDKKLGSSSIRGKAVMAMTARNLKRQKGRSIMTATVIVLAIFTTVFSYNYDKMLALDWTSLLQKEATYTNRAWAMSSGSKLGKVTLENGMNNEQLSLLSQVSGVRRVNGYKQLNASLVGIPIKELTNYYQYIPGAIIQNSSNEWQQLQMARLDPGLQPVNFKIIGVNETILSELMADHNLKEMDAAILYAPLPNSNYEKVDFQDMGLEKNDLISVVYNGNTGNMDFDIAAFHLTSIINSLPDLMSNEDIFKDSICIFINEKNFDNLTNESLYNDIYVYTDESIDFKSSPFNEDISNIASMGRKLFVESRLEKMLDMNNESKILLLRLYVTTGVSVLLSLFILSNMVISSVFARKCEFGMLRAVGMARTQLNSMVSMENCFLSFSAGVGGIFLMIFFVLIRAVSIDETAYQYSFAAQFPWMFSSAAIIFTLIISILVSRYALKKILRKSIIDAIRYVE